MESGEVLSLSLIHICQGELQLPLSDCGVVALDYRGEKGIATSIGHAGSGFLLLAYLLLQHPDTAAQPGQFQFHLPFLFRERYLSLIHI